MKTLHNHLIIFIACSLMAALPGSLAGQQRNNPQSERFEEEKIAFFTEKLNLSEAEAEEFWPVFNDLHNRRMKINQDEKSLLDYYSTNAQYMSDEEVSETVKKYLDLQKQRRTLESEYHDKLVGVLGERKVMTLYSLEREFRFYLLRKFRHQNREGRGRR